MTRTSKFQRGARAVLTVGNGRGFCVLDPRDDNNRLVITAAHCLPHFPPCPSFLEPHIYPTLLAPLGQKPLLCAQCLFADPISDLAVLGSPDAQELSEQADPYEALLESRVPIPIAQAPEKDRGWLLSLEGHWVECGVGYMKRVDGYLWVTDTAQPIAAGMSGSLSFRTVVQPSA
jgi:hypothetical protein